VETVQADAQRITIALGRTAESGNRGQQSLPGRIVV
jgi:hypothetical protein